MLLHLLLRLLYPNAQKKKYLEATLLVVKRIKLNSVGAVAMTIGNNIVVDTKNQNNDSILRHEYCHVKQYKKYGFWGFLFRYYSSMLRLRIKYGNAVNDYGVPLYYYELPLEKEARGCEVSR